jgi:hypothetical protein
MVQRVQLDLEFKVTREELVPQVLQVLLAHKALPAHRDHKALLVNTGQLVQLVLKVLLGHKDNQL